jgi:serine/threonine/tyrosine protein kinase RAD53
MASQLQHTQETQQTQQADYASSFDLNTAFARFVSTVNIGRIETVILPRREPGYVYKFGRHPSCDVKLPGNRFSNIHFKVWEERDSSHYSRYGDDNTVVMIQDTSTNGTFLNQARIGKHNTTVLNNNDEVAAGLGVAADEVRFIVQLPVQSRLVTGTVTGEAAEHMQKYDIRQILGQGAFATVRVAIERSSGTKYAIKILNQRKLSITNASTKATELFRREIDILANAKHPNVVDYVDMWSDDREIFLVIEYLAGGDLMDYIIRRERLPEHEAVHITTQLLDALIYCHSRGITHRDIKPENVLLTTDDPPIAKLTDFGLAKMVEPGTFLKTFCGTLTYVAPEVISLHGRISGAYSSAVDMWSLGCVAFIMVAGSMPFVAEGQDEMMRVIQAGEFDEEKLEEIELSGAGLDFIEHLLVVEPRRRMDGVQARDHPWTRQTMSLYHESQREAQIAAQADEMDHDSQIPADMVERSQTVRTRQTNSYGYTDPSSTYDSDPNLASKSHSHFSQPSSNFVGSSEYGVSDDVYSNSFLGQKNNADSQATITPERMRHPMKQPNWQNGHAQALQSNFV